MDGKDLCELAFECRNSKLRVLQRCFFAQTAPKIIDEDKIAASGKV